MRNVIDHIYFGVYNDIVWEVVERDLPHFKADIDLFYKTPSLICD